MDLNMRAASLAALIEERLGVRGVDLSSKTRKAGRRLPRWARRELQALIEAQSLSGMPKLAPRINHDRIDQGCTRVETWLKSVDPWDRRKGLVLSWLGQNAINILLVAALFVAVLSWRSLI